MKPGNHVTRRPSDLRLKDLVLVKKAGSILLVAKFQTATRKWTRMVTVSLKLGAPLATCIAALRSQADLLERGLC